MGDPSEDYRPSTPFVDFHYKLSSGLFPTHAPKPRFRLLDKDLQLDPAIRHSVQELGSWLASERASIGLLRPHWILLEPQWGQLLDLTLKPHFLSKPNPLTMRPPSPPPSALPQLWPPAYPPPVSDYIWWGDPPVKGDITKALKAAWGLRPVQLGVGKLRNAVLRNLLEDWGARPPHRKKS